MPELHAYVPVPWLRVGDQGLTDAELVARDKRILQQIEHDLTRQIGKLLWPKHPALSLVIEDDYLLSVETDDALRARIYHATLRYRWEQPTSVLTQRDLLVAAMYPPPPDAAIPFGQLIPYYPAARDYLRSPVARRDHQHRSPPDDPMLTDRERYVHATRLRCPVCPTDPANPACPMCEGSGYGPS